MRPRKLVLVWPLLAHAAAWAAFLWLAVWHFAYRGASTQAVLPGSEEVPQVTELSASFVETNGLWVLLPLLVPVVLTGLALLVIWAWDPGGWGRSALLWALAVLALGFCVLLWVLLPLLIPVVLTGLALLVIWAWDPGGWGRSALLWALAVLSLGFCVLGMLSFGILFLPAALALVITAIVGMFQAPRGGVPEGAPGL